MRRFGKSPGFAIQNSSLFQAVRVFRFRGHSASKRKTRCKSKLVGGKHKTEIRPNAAGIYPGDWAYAEHSPSRGEYPIRKLARLMGTPPYPWWPIL